MSKPILGRRIETPTLQDTGTYREVAIDNFQRLRVTDDLALAMLIEIRDAINNMGGGVMVQTVVTDFNATDGITYLATQELTATLPPPTLNSIITIKKTDGDFVVTVAPNGAEEIEGVAGNYLLEAELESATFVADGTNWFRI